jgi:hypothetical protein
VGCSYTIEYTDSLSEPDWKPRFVFDGTGETVEYEDTANISNRYYRMKVDSSIGTTFIWQPLVDTDGDEMPNAWEQTFFASSVGATAALDSDLDGYSNLEEYRLGSDPTNSTSHLNFAVDISAGGAALISSSTSAGRIYIIEYTDSIALADWRLLGGYVGTGSVEQYEDAGFSLSRFYRMRVEIPTGIEL